eukprot:7593708-Alexandrium_andersonii.AAC.1
MEGCSGPRPNSDLDSRRRTRTNAARRRARASDWATLARAKSKGVHVPDRCVAAIPACGAARRVFRRLRVDLAPSVWPTLAAPADEHAKPAAEHVLPAADATGTPRKEAPNASSCAASGGA